MRITQQADYALRITTLLSQQKVPTGASDLAESVKAPQRFTMKLLHELTQKGIVRSTRGAGGGYILAIKAEELTIRQVIEAVDGKIEISKCLSDCHQCLNNPNKSVCRFHNVFAQLNQQLTERLDRLTIAQMAGCELSIEQLIEKVK